MLARGLWGVTVALFKGRFDVLKDLRCGCVLPGGKSSAFCKHGPLHRNFCGNAGLDGGGIAVLLATLLAGGVCVCTPGIGQLHRELPRLI